MYFMKVLIADDDAVSRYILQEILQTLGYDVTTCKDGSEAWETYLAGEFRLVISDWMMPKVDGLEFCRRIRELNRPEYSYFILQTSLHEKEDLLAGLEFGADNYLLKPFDSNDLKIRLKIANRVLALQTNVQALQQTVSDCPVCADEHEANTPHCHFDALPMEPEAKSSFLNKKS
jgi:DNA-binding response OmpR family regulator